MGQVSGAGRSGFEGPDLDAEASDAAVQSGPTEQAATGAARPAAADPERVAAEAERLLRHTDWKYADGRRMMTRLDRIAVERAPSKGAAPTLVFHFAVPDIARDPKGEIAHQLEEARRRVRGLEGQRTRVVTSEIGLE